MDTPDSQIQSRPITFLLPLEPVSRSLRLPISPRGNKLDADHCSSVSIDVLRCLTKLLANPIVKTAKKILSTKEMQSSYDKTAATVASTQTAETII